MPLNSTKPTGLAISRTVAFCPTHNLCSQSSLLEDTEFSSARQSPDSLKSDRAAKKCAFLQSATLKKKTHVAINQPLPQPILFTLVVLLPQRFSKFFPCFASFQVNVTSLPARTRTAETGMKTGFTGLRTICNPRLRYLTVEIFIPAQTEGFMYAPFQGPT